MKEPTAGLEPATFRLISKTDPNADTSRLPNPSTRGRKVGLLLMWVSVLVGAQPRKGKTFATRLLALFAALDPQVRLIVVDGKMSPDWDKFRLVAHRMVFGPVPNSRDNDPVEHLLEVLREVKAHILEVNSQKPSVVGAGDVGRLFNRYRDNHAVRFALKCGAGAASRHRHRPADPARPRHPRQRGAPPEGRSMSLTGLRVVSYGMGLYRDRAVASIGGAGRGV